MAGVRLRIIEIEKIKKLSMPMKDLLENNQICFFKVHNGLCEFCFSVVICKDLFVIMML
jgi:hypothetical protein